MDTMIPHFRDGRFGLGDSGVATGAAENDRQIPHPSFATPNTHQCVDRGVLNTRSFDRKDSDGVANELVSNQKKSHRRSYSLGAAFHHHPYQQRASIGHSGGVCANSSFGFSFGHNSNPFDPLCTTFAGQQQPTTTTSNTYPHYHYLSVEPVARNQVASSSLTSPVLAITPGSSTIASASLSPDPMANRFVVFEFPPNFERDRQMHHPSPTNQIQNEDENQQVLEPFYAPLPPPPPPPPFATPAPTQKALRRPMTDIPRTKTIPRMNMNTNMNMNTPAALTVDEKRPFYSPASFHRVPLQVLFPNENHNNDQDSVLDCIPQASPGSSSLINPDKRRLMKKNRKRCTASGAVSGAIVGGVALGPLGAVIGGAAAGMITKQMFKANGKRAQQRKIVERAAADAAAAVHSGTFA